MIEANSKALAVTLDQIKVDDRIATGARLRLDGLDERHPATRNNIIECE